MSGEFDLSGVLVSSMLLAALAGLAGACAIHRLLVAVGAYRYVWHAALFDLALFLILWAAASGLPWTPPS